MRIVPDISLSINDIGNAIGVKKNFSENTKINGITTNSEDVLKNDIFIALKGENGSGEKYVLRAKEKGAYIISAEYADADFFVNDTFLALLKIASFYKSKLPALKKTVAITGSVGKTTTKNILYSVLKDSFNVHATYENFNNIIGVSYTLLTAPISTEYLILELGMNHLGEISTLSRAVKPDVSVITNIGTSHIGNLGSRELISKAKLEILEGMTSNDIILPIDEPYFKNINGKKFSLTDTNTDYSLNLMLSTPDGSVFDIKTPNTTLLEQNTSLPGKNALCSILICAAVMEALGLDLKILSEKLPFIDSGVSRGKYIKLSDFTVYDDTYSSSPEAVISDFEYLSLSKNKIKSCVLGDMLELGFETEKLHREIGAFVYHYGYRKLYLFGAYSLFFAQGAIEAGMSPNDIYMNTDITAPEITGNQIIENHIPNELILIKASHSIRADRIIDYMKKELSLEK